MKSISVLMLATVAILLVLLGAVWSISLPSTDGVSAGVRVHAASGSSPSWHDRSVNKPLLFDRVFDYRISDLNLIDAGEAWALADGSILHMKNGTWEVDTQFGAHHPGVRALTMISADEGWGAEGRSYESDGSGGFTHGHSRFLHYTGTDWTPVANPVTGTVVSISMADGDEGWAVTEVGEFVQYANGNWQGVTSPTSQMLTSVDMASTESGWAVGDNGTIVQYKNGLWQLDNSPTTELLMDIHARSAQDAWAVGLNSVLHYDGASWTIVHNEGGNDIVMVEANSGWVVGRRILRFTGVEWVSQDVPQPDWPSTSPAVLTSIDMLSADEGWAGGTNGVLLQYTDETTGLQLDTKRMLLPYAAHSPSATE